MTGLYGRAELGHRLVAAVPHGTLADLDVHRRPATAPCVFKGAINEQGWFPRLSTMTSSSWTASVRTKSRQAIKAARAAVLYLTTHSPGLNRP